MTESDLPFFPPQGFFHSILAQQIQWGEEGVLILKMTQKMKEKKEEVVSSRGGAVGLARTGSARAREDLRCREVRDHRGGEEGGGRLKEWALLSDLLNKSLKFFCKNKPQVCCKMIFLNRLLIYPSLISKLNPYQLSLVTTKIGPTKGRLLPHGQKCKRSFCPASRLQVLFRVTLLISLIDASFY